MKNRRTTRSPDRDILIVGGEDHKTGQADNAEDRHAALARLPQLEAKMLLSA